MATRRLLLLVVAAGMGAVMGFATFELHLSSSLSLGFALLLAAGVAAIGTPYVFNPLMRGWRRKPITAPMSEESLVIGQLTDQVQRQQQELEKLKSRLVLKQVELDGYDRWADLAFSREASTETVPAPSPAPGPSAKA
jgi:hypothetical protein